jgi:hypothetical protein
VSVAWRGPGRRGKHKCGGGREKEYVSHSPNLVAATHSPFRSQTWLPDGCASGVNIENCVSAIRLKWQAARPPISEIEIGRKRADDLREEVRQGCEAAISHSRARLASPAKAPLPDA